MFYGNQIASLDAKLMDIDRKLEKLIWSMKEPVKKQVKPKQKSKPKYSKPFIDRIAGRYKSKHDLVQETGLTYQTITTYIRHARADGHNIVRRKIKLKRPHLPHGFVMVSQYKLAKDK